MIIGTEKLYNETKNSLLIIQSFETKTLIREEILGSELNFRDVVPYADLLVSLYKRLSVTALEDFPDHVLNQIREHTNNVRQLFDQILKFSPAQGNPVDRKNQLIESTKSQIPNSFQALHPYISYSLHRSADFQRLDTEARATFRSIEDKADEITKQLTQHEADAKRVLAEIRNVAAEEGITHQAAHFRVEADMHKSDATQWQKQTVYYAIGLGIFALFSLFIHKMPFLKPENTYDAVQLSLSKFLIFSVITYMLFLSARNYFSSKHNEVVNRHRQNALMTHRALVEGTAETGIRDAVLVQAANCIFSPQSSGYSSNGKNDGDSAGQKSVVEILSKSASSVTKS